MNPKKSTTNVMAFDYGYSRHQSHSQSQSSSAPAIADVISVLDNQCDRIEELMSQLNRNCKREGTVWSKLSTLLSNLTVVQHVLGEHT